MRVVNFVGLFDIKPMTILFFDKLQEPAHPHITKGEYVSGFFFFCGGEYVSG